MWVIRTCQQERTKIMMCNRIHYCVTDCLHTCVVPNNSSLMWLPPNSFFSVARVAAYTIFSRTCSEQWVSTQAESGFWLPKCVWVWSCVCKCVCLQATDLETRKWRATRSPAGSACPDVTGCNMAPTSPTEAEHMGHNPDPSSERALGRTPTLIALNIHTP